jgi:hypothetical protein
MPDTGHALVVRYGFRGVPGLLLGFAYLLAVWAGFVGLFMEEAPASVQAVIGFSLVSLLWNLAFILAGLIGLTARAYKAPLTEIVAVDMIAGIMVAWSFMIFVGTQSNQGAIVLLMISFLLFGWASGTRKYLAQRKKVIEAVREE